MEFVENCVPSGKFDWKNFSNVDQEKKFTFLRSMAGPFFFSYPKKKKKEKKFTLLESMAGGFFPLTKKNKKRRRNQETEKAN